MTTPYRPVNTKMPNVPTVTTANEHGFWFYFTMVVLSLLVLMLIGWVLGNSSARSANRNDNRSSSSLINYNKLVGTTFKGKTTDNLPVAAQITDASEENNKIVVTLTPNPVTDRAPQLYTVISANESVLVGRNNSGELRITKGSNNSHVMTISNNNMTGTVIRLVHNA